MSDYPKFDPNQPPPPLMTGEPGSFAYRTMITRIPSVIENVLADYDNRYPPQIRQALQKLRDEIVADKPIQPLEPAAFDSQQWAQAWAPYPKATWLNCPWYLAEAFLYRRILAATGYFGQNDGAGVDPYLPRKEAELRGDVPWQILEAALRTSRQNAADSLWGLLHHGVWGNRVDLSYTKIAESVSGQIALEQEQANLLVDDSQAVLGHLQTRGGRAPVIGRRLDFICDNAGTELLLDLALADFLLRFEWAAQVTLHLKAYPTFVSDATRPDTELTIKAIRAKPSAELQKLANRLEKQLLNQRLRLQPDPFWNSPYFFWELPQHLQAELAQAHLVIIKGDANYRRLLGDSRWPTTVPIAAAVPYLPAPFVALRTMKSDPVVGLQPGQADRLDQVDPDWRVNGKRGMIQARF